QNHPARPPPGAPPTVLLAGAGDRGAALVVRLGHLETGHEPAQQRGGSSRAISARRWKSCEFPDRRDGAQRGWRLAERFVSKPACDRAEDLSDCDTDAVAAPI